MTQCPATLSVSRDALRLWCFGRDYVFLRCQVVSLSGNWGIFNVGLRIHHTVPTYPKFVVFWFVGFPWSSRLATLKARLERLGYKVRN